ncbi:MAG: secondary thiamine-phosphate synthase enzyme YjbQ [Nitrospinota bacterium]|nr:secondary thiamine-phosphate synthase enzyme YjbQ [Nitrospinota bacterium]
MSGGFSVRTRSRTDFVEITREIHLLLGKAAVDEGVVHVFTPHTTAGLTINENADPSVLADMAHALDRMVPWSDPAYSHSEGNSAAHLKSSLVGCSLTVPFSGGKLELGTWQGVYLCEFDGPRTRQVKVRVIGSQ